MRACSATARAHGIHGTWEARERVVVALTGGPEGETLIRRAARIAARSTGGDLLAVHVTRSDGLTGANPAALAGQRRLAESLGGSYHQVVGDNVPETLLTFARAENADAAGPRGQQARLGGIAADRSRREHPDDPRLRRHRRAYRDARSHGPRPGLPRADGGLPLRRRLAGYALAAVLAPLLTLMLVSLRGQLNLTTDVLLFLVAVIAVGPGGGFVLAVLAAIAGSAAHFFFTPPIHRFTIADANNVLALVIFVAVALVVSFLVRRRRATDPAGRPGHRRVRADGHHGRQRAARSACSHGGAGPDAEAFSMESVTLLERGPEAAVPPSGLARAGEISSLADLCSNTTVVLKNTGGQMKVYLDREDVEYKIRTEEVGLAASKISTFAVVREKLLALQREAGIQGGIVAKGRDMGSVVFPHADYKFYLDAHLEERIKRRHKELSVKDASVEYKSIQKDMLTRDKQDKQRELAPLKAPDGAIIIDSDNLSVEQVVDKILFYIQ